MPASNATGAVWYFGADVTAFTYDAGGVLTGTEKAPSWTAGVDEARPGIVIEADPVLAKVMFRAFAPKAGEAEFSVVEGLAADKANLAVSAAWQPWPDQE